MTSNLNEILAKVIDRSKHKVGAIRVRVPLAYHDAMYVMRTLTGIPVHVQIAAALKLYFEVVSENPNGQVVATKEILER